jgi:hypothetical protein
MGLHSKVWENQAVNAVIARQGRVLAGGLAIMLKEFVEFRADEYLFMFCS